jgi:16S rRNA (uracil1498-N3)-methyltransferase
VHCLLSKISASVVAGHYKVNVALALIKQDRFEWCLEKLTEIGVNEITPVQTRHCVARLSAADQGDERIAAKLARWQAITKEAAEQSERATIPPVVKPQKLDDYLQRSTSGGTDLWRFICAERSDAAPLVKALTGKISSGDLSGGDRDKTICLLIGPEGGFAPEEISAAISQGCLPVTLGSRILRSETAAIVAMSQVASVLDI